MPGGEHPRGFSRPCFCVSATEHRKFASINPTHGPDLVKVPWPQVKLDEWHQRCETIEVPATDDSTDMMKELGKSFERSLAGFVTEFQSASLSSAHCGRAQRLQPAHVMPSAPTCRASRPGEAHLVADTAGKAVLVWFKQLRRLQSFRHAACAGQQHEAAVQYRIELWSSVRRKRF